MADFTFRLMRIIMILKDRLYPSIDKRVVTFGIREGMTVVDYGCVPGRYAVQSLVDPHPVMFYSVDAIYP